MLSHNMKSSTRYGLSPLRGVSYDVAVVGGGPGGYVAAIKAAQSGMKVACIEERATLGGTCLNVGCIPTKALLNATQKYHEMRSASKYGITVEGVKFNFGDVQKAKEKTVSGLTKGIEFLFKKNKVDFIRGRGSLVDPTRIKAGDKDIQATHIILATGSEPSPMPGGTLTINESNIVSSTGALALKSVPNKLIVIGGGAIGLEFASIFSRLGSAVEVIEFMPQIAVGYDRDVSEQLQKLLQKDGIKFHLNHKVVSSNVAGNKVTVKAQASDGTMKEFAGDVVLVSVGRRPNSRNLGLEALGVITDKQNRVLVDDEFKTNISSVRAIGDLIPGPMLAHKAEEDAAACVGAITGNRMNVDYSNMPGVIYTHPEVASVGFSEAQLHRDGIKFNKGLFPMAANSRARSNMESDGFVKILSCTTTDRILGATILAPQGGDLIQELVLAKQHGITATQIADTVHPHPCLSEAIKEAALLATKGKAIHV